MSFVPTFKWVRTNIKGERDQLNFVQLWTPAEQHVSLGTQYGQLTVHSCVMVVHCDAYKSM
jgi:hypothetical protein